MRWFRLNKSFYASGDTGTYAAYNVVTNPVIYNEKIYGTETNLMYETYVRGDIISRYYYVYPVSGTQLSTSYFRIVGSPTDNLLNWGEELPNAVISGRYRFYSNLSGGLYGGWGIPLNFTIYKTDGTNISGDYIQGISGSARFPDYTYCGLYFGDIKADIKTLFGNSAQGTSAELSSSLKNCIIDFGRTPQNIPKFIKDWFDSNGEIIYPYSYTVKNQSGTEEYVSINEAPTMVSGNLTVVGDTKTLLLTGSNDKTYTLQWDSVTPEGKQFTGISFSPNSKIANIPVGVETYFNLEGDVSLYESYGIYRPPVTTFNVNLYQNTAEANRVDKTNYISSVGTLSGVLRDESSITDVTITFESESIPTFNYVYIPVFNRYYFVNDITSLKYKLWQMSLSVDPLMTYKDAILSCNGFIDRNENEYNSNIIDKKRVVAQGHTVQVDSVTNELFTATSGTYVLNGLLVSVYSE